MYYGSLGHTEQGETVALVLMISLPPAIARGNAITRLNAGMTLIGFGVSFVLILMGGWFSQAAGWIEMALIPSLVFMPAAFAALEGEGLS